LRVLVVDDNEMARQITAEMTSSLGWQTDLCSDGADAVQKLAAGEGQPYQVALIDWQMPGMNGWQTAKQIRKLDCGTELPLIVMVTAHDREELAARIEAEHALTDGLLNKPFAASDLFNAVAETLRADGVQLELSGSEAAQVKRLDGLRILVVEDNVTNQMVARELLAHEGAIVEVAGGGLLAIDVLTATPARFDAVLMDVQMPDLDGYETTRRIRNTLGLQELPIVAMTANTMQTDREAAFAAGMNEHIGKPFELEQVVNTLLAQCGRAPAAKADTAAATDLPADPEGFAVQPALQRLGNNRQLYARQARRFAAQYGSDHDAIREMLDSGDTTGAANRLHTLRGVAATLGAQALAAHAAEFEADIKKASPAQNLSHPTDCLGRLLQDAGRTLLKLADGIDPVAPQSGNGASPDDAELKPLLATLESHLADGNMRAMDVYAELRPMLAGIPEDMLAKLDMAFDGLDFGGAQQVLRELADGEVIKVQESQAS
jgi:CheY-like chemotaxis protein